MKINILFISFISFFVLNFSYAQIITDTIEINKDATVRNGTFSNSNYGTSDNLFAYLAQGSVLYRSFVEINLSEIPYNATIISAHLVFDNYLNSGFQNENYSVYIQRVAESWYEDSITWNNQPLGITSGQYSYTRNDSLSIFSFDVTNQASYMVKYPNLNHGWIIKLQNETLVRGLRFASSDHTTKTAPRIIIEYKLPIEITQEIKHCTHGNNDGTIEVEFSGGSGNYNYYWFYKVTSTTPTLLSSGSAFSNPILFDSLEAGLYLFRVRDDQSTNYAYKHKYFLIGSEGDTTNVEFPFGLGETYIEDANLLLNTSTVLTTDNENTNYGNTTDYVAGFLYPTSGTSFNSEGLTMYNLDYDNELKFIEATFINNPHAQFYKTSTSSNERAFTAVTEPWEEMIVTWNTKPAIDSSTSIILPTTSTNGFMWQYDTINFLSLAEYWQTHPNYGVMIHLTDYNQPANAFAQYKSSGGQNGVKYFLSYTVKPKLTPEFFDEKAEGNINVIAPPGDLPYTYLLSYEPIPDLNTIWQSIKDSIPIDNGFPIFDSLYFFQGKENTYNYTFEGLKAERYYVAVFDNNGDEIFQSSTVLSTDVLLYNFDDIIHLNDSIYLDTNATGDGKADFFVELDKNENGGIEFIIANLDDFTFGFNYTNDSLLTDETDLEFGFKITSTNNLNVYLNGAFVEDYSVSQGDTLRLMKNENFYQIYKNKALLHEDSIAIPLTDNLKIDMIFPNGKVAVLAGVLHIFDFIKPKPIFKDIIHAECPDGLGQITLSVPNSYYSKSVTTINIVNQITEESVPGPIDDDDILNLGVGIYTISYAYTYYFPIGHPLYPSVSYPGGTQEFIIGYPVEWLYSNPDDNIFENGLNNIRKNNPSLSASVKSLNSTPIPDDWWYNFQTLNNIYSVNSVGITFQNSSGSFPTLFIIQHPSTLNKFLSFNGQTLMIDNSKSITIIQEDNEITIKNNGNVILPLSGTYSNSNTETLIIKPTLNNGLILANNLVSFCSNYPIPLQYVQLHRKLPGGYYLVPLDDVLRVKYIEEYMDSDGDLNFTIYDKTGTEQTITTPIIIFGDNRIDFDVSSLTEGYYILEIKNDKNEKFYLRFRVQ